MTKVEITIDGFRDTMEHVVVKLDKSVLVIDTLTRTERQGLLEPNFLKLWEWIRFYSEY